MSIELEKENHNQLLEDKVRNMTTQEKIEYLEREKKFWEDVATYEKYNNIEINKNKENKKTRF